MPAMPHAVVRLNRRRTGRTRYRVHQSRGWFLSRGHPAVLVLQLEWICDVQDCNSRQVTGCETEWRDAAPEDLINAPAEICAPIGAAVVPA